MENTTNTILYDTFTYAFYCTCTCTCTCTCKHEYIISNLNRLLLR